ncbi:hypothetical protein L7F22_040895 [Adiantum nelumboides]|nr:hypothetical protein [Adiantum nelumboides]
MAAAALRVYGLSKLRPRRGARNGFLFNLLALLLSGGKGPAHHLHLYAETRVHAENQSCAQLNQLQDIAAVNRPAAEPASCCRSLQLRMSSCIRIPKGYLPVLLVGDGNEESSCAAAAIVVMRVSLLGHPLLQELLKRSALEFGYSGAYTGALKLPCNPLSFMRLLAPLSTSLPSSSLPFMWASYSSESRP